MRKQSYRLQELADVLSAELRGSPDYLIDGLATLEAAQASQLSFISKAAYRKHLKTTRAGALILDATLAADYAGNVLVVDNPYLAFARLSGLFCPRPATAVGVHPSASIHPEASIAPSAAIGPHCVVEAGATIGEQCELSAGIYIGAGTCVGEGCRLYPNVTLYHGVILGKYVTVHSATTIGSDGFGFAPSADGWVKIHQLGGVCVGDRVEIGAGCTIDRGALNDTVIGEGVIIDNQVHLAHNVVIGKNTAIAGCCGIAGSTTVGANCLLGGGVLISGHLTIADNVQFNGATVVTKSIREPGVYASGTPIQPVRQWQKNAVRYGQLEKLVERVKHLEGQVKKDD